MGRSDRVAPLRWVFVLSQLYGLWQPFARAAAQAAGHQVPVLMIDGAIGPATVDYIVNGIAAAEQDDSRFVVIRIDTPGGLDTSMREIILAIVNSSILVIIYVSLSSGWAASVGALILTSSHMAVMAPGTNVGAATPVPPGAPGPDTIPGAGEDVGTDGESCAGGAKALNNAIAYIRSLDEMLAERDKLNADIQQILDAQTDAWGIKVANVAIKHVDIDESMVRAIARQAEADREWRAKAINAEGEQQAAQKLLEAADILGQRREAMQLRYLSTLNVIAGERIHHCLSFPARIHGSAERHQVKSMMPRSISSRLYASIDPWGAPDHDRQPI